MGCAEEAEGDDDDDDDKGRRIRAGRRGTRRAMRRRMGEVERRGRHTLPVPARWPPPAEGNGG